MDGSPVASVELFTETRRRSSRSVKNQTDSKSPSRETKGSCEDDLNAKSEQPTAAETGPTGRPIRHTNRKVKKSDAEVIYDALKPLTDEERMAWTGWCELESDPALFNFILREYGVKNVKIQEVVSLEDDMLQYLPQPVYGLVFLFRYRDEDSDEDKLPKCPNHVWFANQTTHNACATIAMLNIIMNVPELDLGENISSFKEETRGLKPAYRGQRLSQNDDIRNIHNSFARRMDILNADLSLFNEVTTWKKQKPKKSSKRKVKQEDEASFHFIAYVPVDGVVWRLDGLQHQPVNLGPYEGNWISVARANINHHINQYDDLQFNLLSLCKSPLATIPPQLAQNIHAIRAVECALSKQMPDWKNLTQFDELGLIKETCGAFGISDKLLHDTELPLGTQAMLSHSNADANTLLQLLQQWTSEQRGMRAAYLEEVSSIDQENVTAAKRKEDHTPLIYRTIRTLAEKGLLMGILEEFED